MDTREDALRTLGRRLTHLREIRELSIAGLAALTSLDPSDIAAIEAGELDLRLTTIFALARALGVAPDQLLTSG